MKHKVKLITVIIMGMFIAGCNNSANKEMEAPFDGEVNHVHGMGYAGNDDGLYFATHTGLKIYRQGNWFETPDNFFDYMGFNPVDKGFYTSGHPSADSDLPNPLGIQRSLDSGESLEHIVFEGESDFHAMAVGYESHDIFLLNHTKNTLLEQGFYKSFDEGASWASASANGLEGEVSALALHPTDSNFVAAATSAGVYLSEDSGENFSLLTKESEAGTAVFFSNDFLYFASYGAAPSLTKYTIENKDQEAVNLPALSEDGVAYIFQNPNDMQQIAIYTVKGQAYLMESKTGDWQQILKDGNTQ